MKKIFISVLVMMIAAAGLTGCKEKVGPGVRDIKRAQVTGISIGPVISEPLDDYYETSGTVKARTVSLVSSRLMGTITSVRVKEGDRVGTGQVLLTLDDSDVLQKVRGAQEGYIEAQKGAEAAQENKRLREITYQRYKKIYEEKALTRQELDQIETQKKVADLDYDRAAAAVRRVEAGMNEARVFHSFSRVTSPVSGIVTEKKAEVGSMAVPGMPLITVEDNSGYRLEINADEKISGKIRPGMEVNVFIESLNKEIKGSVTDVVQAIDPASRSFLVKISLKDEGLRSGLYAKVAIPIGKKDTLAIPRGAIVEKGQLTGVYTVDATNVITYRLIRAGKSHGDRVEILSGLHAGDKVIISGVERAVDGGIAAAAQKQ